MVEGRSLRCQNTWRGAGALPTQAGGAWAPDKLKANNRQGKRLSNKGKQTSKEFFLLKSWEKNPAYLRA